MSREMKDSGIEWVGKIPVSWSIKKLNAFYSRKTIKNRPNERVLSVYREYGVIPKDSRSDNHNVTSENTSAYLLVQPTNLVVNKMKAWQGSMGISNHQGIVSPAYFVYQETAVPRERRFFHYLLRSNIYAQEFRRLSRGMREGQWDLTAYDFERTPIIVPPLLEQQQIATFLDIKCSQIDRLSDNIKQQIEELGEYKKALITQAVTKGLDPDVEMKDSGIEWIGEIPSDWSISKLKYVASIIGGNGFPEYLQGEDTDEIPFYKAGDISAAVRKISDSRTYISRIIADKHRFNLIPSGAILMPKIGEAMKKNSRALSTKICCIDNNCQAIVPSNQVEQDYCYYLLCIVDMNDFDNAGTIPSLNNSKLLNLQIPFPPKKTQHAIANYLDSKCSQIDALIANTEAQIASLGEYKKALITQAVTKGLDPDVEMKDSGIEWIGEIPEEWQIIRIKHLVNMKGRIGWQGLKSDEFLDEGPYLISGTDFENGNINWTSCKHISEERFQQDPNIHIRENDLLITKDGTIGKLAVVSNCREKVSLNSGVMILRSIGKYEYDSKFLYYNLMSDAFHIWFGMSDTGQSTIKHLTQEKFENYSIGLPSITEQQSIASYLDSKCSQIDALIQTKSEILNVLQEYKKSLIFDYVTGKKEVPVSYRKDGCHE